LGEVGGWGLDGEWLGLWVGMFGLRGLHFIEDVSDDDERDIGVLVLVVHEAEDRFEIR
jgi:hypothetical protein